jgi:hypothetical protein
MTSIHDTLLERGYKSESILGYTPKSAQSNFNLSMLTSEINKSLENKVEIVIIPAELVPENFAIGDPLIDRYVIYKKK